MAAATSRPRLTAWQQRRLSHLCLRHLLRRALGGEGAVEQRAELFVRRFLAERYAPLANEGLWIAASAAEAAQRLRTAAQLADGGGAGGGGRSPSCFEDEGPYRHRVTSIRIGILH
eukprot:COSAG01_NODE_993_length_12256_cov_6.798964_7_plen_116_part_00